MDIATQVKHIEKEKHGAVVKLAQQSRRTKQIPDRSTEPWKSLHQRVDDLLSWLDGEVRMSPELKRRGRVDELLKLIYVNPNFHFEDAQKLKAQELNRRFEDEQWGAPPEIKREDDGSDQDDDEDEIEDESLEQSVPKRRKSGAADSKKDDSYIITRPPANHPIWGVNGIMHGIAVRRTGDGRKSKMLNDRYATKDPKVYGHNGLTVGQWFPFRLCALFAGAHGASQAGIHGSKATGAYSVVVGGTVSRPCIISFL